MRIRVYQLAPGCRPRDAVGRMALALHDRFTSWGAASLLFTEDPPSPRFGPWFLGPRRGGFEGHAPWSGEPAPDLAIYQHCIGSRVADRFLAWPAKKKILIYQNITPADRSDLDPRDREAREWGRRQLVRLVRETDLQIAPSAFTEAELTAAGAKRIARWPYLLWKRPLSPGPAERPGNRILVVARVVPHKGVREAIEAFAELRRRGSDAVLDVVGSLRGDPRYVDELRARIAAFGLNDRIRLRGRVSDRKLASLYRSASVFLSLSEHEGYGVPIAEAIVAGTPVVAYPGGAVAETLGEAGLLVDDREPETVADALERALSDRTWRAKTLEIQRVESLRFDPESVADSLRRLVGGLAPELTRL